MDIKKVRALVELFESSQMAELEIKEGEEVVRMARHSPLVPSFGSVPVSLDALPRVQPTGPAPISLGSAVSTPRGHTVTAPMVGTFYRAVSEGEGPFVELGQPVKAGEPVCIIEAMKMFNQIEADKAGVVRQILVENGHPVEFGQPLFVLEEG